MQEAAQREVPRDLLASAAKSRCALEVNRVYGAVLDRGPSSETPETGSDFGRRSLRTTLVSARRTIGLKTVGIAAHGPRARLGWQGRKRLARQSADIPKGHPLLSAGRS
jgi:hypothetical protein